MNNEKHDASVTWKIHCKSGPARVFEFLTTDAGRSKFWAEKTKEQNDQIVFEFSNGINYTSRVIQKMPPSLFVIEYFGSIVSFQLDADGKNGTDVTVFNEGIAEEEYFEVHAGWISVLLALKAAVDFNVDIRNHDPGRSWDQLYVDN